MAEIAHARTGIDIHPGATIGSGFFIDHGTGVVIGETAIIGETCASIRPSRSARGIFPADDEGNLIKGDARHPIVEDDVVIYAGATILGRITIGRGSTIGGNVWLTKDVPPNSVVTQATAQKGSASPPFRRSRDRLTARLDLTAIHPQAHETFNKCPRRLCSRPSFRLSCSSARLMQERRTRRARQA